MENVHRFFATEVALITTNSSKYGPNVMAVTLWVNRIPVPAWNALIPLE